MARLFYRLCGIQDEPVAFRVAGRKTRPRVQYLLDRGFGAEVWIDIDPKNIGNRVHGVEVVEPAWLENSGHTFVLNYVINHGARDIARNYLERIAYVMGQDYLELG